MDEYATLVSDFLDACQTDISYLEAIAKAGARLQPRA